MIQQTPVQNTEADQQRSSLCLTQDKADVIAVGLEFDESSSRTRLRSGILDIEATYPILVPCGKLETPGKQLES